MFLVKSNSLLASHYQMDPGCLEKHHRCRRLLTKTSPAVDDDQLRVYVLCLDMGPAAWGPRSREAPQQHASGSLPGRISAGPVGLV